MFESIDNNRVMILGAYKKLKSYYYYDKSLLYNKVNISTWESNPSSMDKRIERLANFMCTLESTPDYKYFNTLMHSMDLIPFPKGFADEQKANDIGAIIDNHLPKNCSIESVNFFIKLPVELLILDIIWMLMVSKIAYNQKAVSYSSYANKIRAHQLFNSESDLFLGIDFNSNRLFVPYFRQYKAWRDNSFNTVKKQIENHKDCVLISLDIKSYYYSVTFSFSDLNRLLNDDTRLIKIEPLTKIIQQIYLDYTAEMKKYRGSISADCNKGQCALPIGLHSSMLLANLYLKDFDKAVERSLFPMYYGRYVDDIIIVIDKPQDSDCSVKNILENSLVKNGIIKPKDSNCFCLLNVNEPTNSLLLQSNKIRCICFDHDEPDVLIKLICEANQIKPSVSDGELLPDFEIDKQSFDEQAYSLSPSIGSLKIRELSYYPDSYKAILFINDLIKACKNIDVENKKHISFIRKQLIQILKFYNHRNAIEYRSAWINIFSLILINKCYEYFGQFYNQIKVSIDSVTTNSIQSIDNRKEEEIVCSIRSALFEQLDIAASIAIAPFSIQEAERAINHETNRVNTDIFENAKDIRNANMFNNHLTSFPLISYICDDKNYDFSFVTARPSEISEIFANKNFSILPTLRKISFCPRFIHYDELCLLFFLINFNKGGNPFLDKLDEIHEVFVHTNKLVYNVGLPNEYIQNHVGINVQKLKFNTDTKNSKIRIALASVKIDENNDVKPVLRNPLYDLSLKKKIELYRLLNEAKKNHSHFVVFPEFFLPIDWIEDVYTFSRKNSIAIICGLRYITCNYRAFNYSIVLQPFSLNGFKYTLSLFREKIHYAPQEKVSLAANGFDCMDTKNPSLHIIHWGKVKYSDLMCYELTNIAYRYLLRNEIDFLIVPELNMDTVYFSNIVEATSRDLHCFVVQSNTSKYGDSRITGPYNSNYKNIVQIKGAEDNSILLMGVIDYLKVQKKQKNYPKEIKEKIGIAKFNQPSETHATERKLKDPPAGYYELKGEENE